MSSEQTTFSIATSVSGLLEIHQDGRSHLRRLYAGGGGVLSSGLDARAAWSQALAEDAGRPKWAACVAKEGRRAARV
jgi:hypothetical protein